MRRGFALIEQRSGTSDLAKLTGVARLEPLLGVMFILRGNRG